MPRLREMRKVARLVDRAKLSLIVDENVRNQKTRLTDAILSFKLAIGQSLYKTYTYITKNLMYFRM